MYQQGDVMIVPVSELAEPHTRRDGNQIAGNVLALGEATGHAHVAEGVGVTVREVVGDAEIHAWLDAPNGATITHQEHGTVQVPPGRYAIMLVPEHDYEAGHIRNVRD